jgi:thymidylate kinase
MTHTVDLIGKLCKTLLVERINYCHWKSNAALDRSSCGINDLDLLVDRADSQAFIEILYRLGFKESESPDDLSMPGVHNYYGYDKISDVIVNVHAHYQMILGHDLTKNYHFPIETAYLNSSVQGDLFRVPAPEFELIVFVLRMVIKHFTWDTFLLRHWHLSGSEIRELDYLVNRVSETKMLGILSANFKNVDPKVFTNCLLMMKSDCSVWEKIRVGQKIVNYIDSYSRTPRLIDIGYKFFRRFSIPLKLRILRKDFRMQLRNGGLMVAIVGGDGAGKSTVVQGILAWLGGDFTIRKFHMGKPSWSFTTFLVHGILKIGRILRLYPFQLSDIQYTDDTNELIFPGYPWLFREVCTARDRYLTYLDARRYSTNGGIAILDRFPLSQIKYMDGPLIARMAAKIPPNRLIKALTIIEEGYYQKMALPDLLIVLRVDPQIAVQRKSDEAEKDVRPRSTEIWCLNWEKTSAHVIDASQSKEVVLCDVKELIWSRL